jgi:CHAT domain-containing protein/Tfp pilus assembly protein PilF
MNVPRPQIPGWARQLAAVALAVLAGAAPLRAADPAAPAPLSAEERSRLEKQVADLNERAGEQRQQGHHAEAARLLEQVLALHRRLYPADQFPQGRPDLATTLGNLGIVLAEQGQYGRAANYQRQALAMLRRLYPADRYPQGHPDLATGLRNLGFVLSTNGEDAEALDCFTQALAMDRRLYPREKYPDGHLQLALSLHNLASFLHGRGEYARAITYQREAVEMFERLFPEDRYPQGDPFLAKGLANLGLLLKRDGEYGKALGYYQRALAMKQRLYPREKYPQGHPDLAAMLDNLAGLLLEQRKYAEALDYRRQALAMYQGLYPADRYPQGHPDLVICLGNLGHQLREQGVYGQALGYAEQALQMSRRLHPPDRYPQGHPDLARCLDNLGYLLTARGEYGRALDYHRQALAMYQRLYPREQYPDGHPDLAKALHNLGGVLHAQGQYAEALGYYGQGLDMHGRLVGAFADAAAEAEALNYLVSLPGTRGILLSCSASAGDASAEEAYAALWQHKAAVTAVVQRRQLLLHARDDEATRPLADELAEVRRRLARLLLAPAGAPARDRERRLAELTGRKEALERRLAEALPEFARRQTPERAPHGDLVKQLPPGTAFVDLVHFDSWDPQTRRWGEGRYAAFVLQRGEPIRRAELGPAVAISRALERWRRDIEDGRGSKAADELRRLVWEPIARHLRPGTETVYLAPEGLLALLPWAALPGSKSGSVLLEEHALALVPHGPFLLDQLTAAEPTRSAGTAVVLGGVDYAQGPEAIPDGQAESRRPADRGRGSLSWPALPGTAAERDQVTALARLLAGAEVVELGGREAGTERLLRELPRARWAHLATHGFFATTANEDERRRLLRDADFAFGVRQERRGAGARNPLVQMGLVLAGANRPPAEDVLADDRGLLTGEALAGLDLRGLELCVLSACNTGRGEDAGGEGAFGLQRALHLAGCKSVVASLWKVDDDATAALMALFYRNLWEKKQPPLQALRSAQLTLRRHPASVPLLAKERGPNFDLVIKRVQEAPAEPSPDNGEGAAVKHWAAFVLSGLGR